MRIESIPYYMEKREGGSVVLQFMDGDQYPLSALDGWGENDDGEFEIRVSFKDCLELSNRQAEAVRLGRKAVIPGCVWTTAPAVEPVGMVYTLEDIEAIDDLDTGTCVYRKQSA